MNFCSDKTYFSQKKRKQVEKKKRREASSDEEEEDDGVHSDELNESLDSDSGSDSPK